MFHLKPCCWLAAVLLPATALAHSHVTLDRHGCHRDTASKRYHCHEGPFAEREFDNKSDMLRALDPRKGAPLPSRKRRVVEVLDVASLVLANGERVRLIGVEPPGRDDPPHSDRAAVAFVRGTLWNDWIELSYDPANAARSHRDRAGRTLAYVLLRNGESLNAAILRHGFGHAVQRGVYEEKASFLAAEAEARASRRGLWNRGPIRRR